jgi:hypothetical protein
MHGKKIIACSKKQQNHTQRLMQQSSRAAVISLAIETDRTFELQRDLEASNHIQSERLTSLADRSHYRNKFTSYKGKGVLGLLAIATSLGLAASCLLLEFLPSEILTRIDNNPIRLPRIEKQLNPTPNFKDQL